MEIEITHRFEEESANLAKLLVNYWEAWTSLDKLDLHLQNQIKHGTHNNEFLLGLTYARDMLRKTMEEYEISLEMIR